MHFASIALTINKKLLAENNFIFIWACHRHCNSRAIGFAMSVSCYSFPLPDKKSRELHYYHSRKKITFHIKTILNF